MGVIETLEAERVDIAKALRDLAVKAEQENGGVIDGPLLDQVNSLKEKFIGKGSEIERARSLVATHSEIDAFLSDGDAADLNAEVLKGTQVGLGGKRAKSVGGIFTGSDNYKALMHQFPNGIGETTKGINSGPVQVPGGLKALLTGADHTASAGTLVRPDYYGVVPYPTTPFGLRNLITTGTTGSDKIEYAQYLPITAPGGSTNNAAVVKEATTVGGTDGTKPQSDMKFKKASADVLTIAHWIAATKRALSDAAQLRTYIDAFLRDGIARKIDELIISGDKDTPTAPDQEEWDGILNTAGVQDVPFDTDAVTVSRKIITAVTNVGGVVTGFAVSPAVAESIDLAKDGNDRYLGNGPFSVGPNTLWGVPRVTVYGIPDDVIIGGQFTTCILWDREQTTVTATDAHADFFVRNIVAILAEARAAFAVMNPQLLAIGHTEATTP